jgi:hypothetical protein
MLQLEQRELGRVPTDHSTIKDARITEHAVNVNTGFR